jgi:hypothetical protein
MSMARLVLTFAVFIDLGLFSLSNMFPIGYVFDVQDCISTNTNYISVWCGM